MYIATARHGDTKVAWLYFDFIGQGKQLPGKVTSNKNQNNYIQLSGIKVSQETLKQLSLEQLNQIEGL